MDYRLIALDLDGTLLDSKKEITPRTRRALERARQRGIVTVVATGRTPHSALHISRKAGGGPVICCNGAGVIDETGAFIISRGMPRAPLQRLLEMGREAGFLLECYTPEGLVLDRPLEMARSYLGWVRPKQGFARAIAGLAKVWKINRVRPVRNLVTWVQRPESPPVLKVMVMGQPERLGAWASQVTRAMPGLEVTSSGPENLEITAGGVSKASGLQQLGARLKIPREAIIAVGDSENDLDMLRYAGLGVAMGNACETVKAVARRVTASCDDDGVARLLEELCP